VVNTSGEWPAGLLGVLLRFHQAIEERLAGWLAGWLAGSSSVLMCGRLVHFPGSVAATHVIVRGCWGQLWLAFHAAKQSGCEQGAFVTQPLRRGTTAGRDVQQQQQQEFCKLLPSSQ
jgi:hypothetical protein